MRLVPIPTTDEHLRGSARHWLPFLSGISRRSRESVEQLIDLISRREVQPVLVWDEVELKAVALAGVRFVMRGKEKIGEVVWLTGTGRKTWQHLLTDLEQYMRDMGCVECRPVCRLGWARLLKQQGYKATHLTMEKKL